jgi:hypothetical protein
MAIGKERLVVQSKTMLNEIMHSPFKIFLRTYNWEPVGILTKREHKYDPGWGGMRIWATGLTLDGKKFSEPLDRKNRRTGELEDLVQMETDMILVTARSSEDPDDENEDNFQYLIGPHQSNRFKDMEDRIKERDRIIHDMEKKIMETERLRDFYQRESEAYGNEIRMLKTRVGYVSEKLADSEQQTDHYRTLVKVQQISNLGREGSLDEQMNGARGRGAFQAKDSADVIVEAATKQKQAQKQLTTMGVGNTSAEFATKSDLQEMEGKIDKLLDTMAKIPSSSPQQLPEKKKSPIPPKIAGRPPEED